MKRFFSALIIMLSLIFAGCHDYNENESEDVSEGTAVRNILMYMNSENNLSQRVSSVIDTIKTATADISSSYNVLLYYDLPDSLPVIMRIHQGESEVVRIYGDEVNSSDPKQLSDVLTWVQTNYAAASWGLILWGHGSGWIIENTSAAASRPRRAFGYDNGTGSKLWMDYDDLASTLANYSKFSFILFDCCNGQNIEVAYELKDLTDWIIGSPAEVPAVGFPYLDILPTLFYGTESDYGDMIGAIADSYGIMGIPMSVIYTDGLDYLATMTKKVLLSISSYTSSTIADADTPYLSSGRLVLSVDSLPYYYEDSLGTDIEYDMLGVIKRNCPTLLYSSWLETFDHCVPYSEARLPWRTDLGVNFNLFGDNFKENFGGVSMFVPLPLYDSASSVKDYNSLISRYQWYTAVGWDSLGW